MSFPAIDLAGIQRRSFLRPSYFDTVEQQSPGYTSQSIASNTSWAYARLRKRYGGNLPWGQTPPTLVPAGLTPPSVTLTGIPTLGSLSMLLQITTGGPLGAAVFRWSSDGGITWAASGVTTAASVQLGTTGMTAVFSDVGTYDTSNQYAAATPVPEAVLRWITIFTTFDVWRRHGVNPNDPLMQGFVDEVKAARAEVEEAANTQTGLFDLPVSEDQGSAVDTGGPLAYSEQSPYTWTYRQACAAQQELCGAVTWPCPPNKLVGG